MSELQPVPIPRRLRHQQIRLRILERLGSVDCYLARLVVAAEFETNFDTTTESLEKEEG
jgi:hypothetical protein